MTAGQFATLATLAVMVFGLGFLVGAAVQLERRDRLRLRRPRRAGLDAHTQRRETTSD